MQRSKYIGGTVEKLRPKGAEDVSPGQRPGDSNKKYILRPVRAAQSIKKPARIVDDAYRRDRSGNSMARALLLMVVLAVFSLRVAVFAASASDPLSLDSYPLGEALPLVEAFSGHIAILPGLPGENLRTTSVGKAL